MDYKVRREPAHVDQTEIFSSARPFRRKGIAVPPHARTPPLLSNLLPQRIAWLNDNINLANCDRTGHRTASFPRLSTPRGSGHHLPRAQFYTIKNPGAAERTRSPGIDSTQPLEFQLPEGLHVLSSSFPT